MLLICPHCGNNDERMIEEVGFALEDGHTCEVFYCQICAREFSQLIIPEEDEV